MTIKVRDAANALKTATFKMRDASNVLRTVSTIKMRDASNVLKTAFVNNPVSISPKSVVSSFSIADETFTATITGTPSSTVWSTENVFNGTTAILSGQGTAVARIRLTTSGGGGATATCTVRCTVVIGGVSYSDTATMTST